MASTESNGLCGYLCCIILLSESSRRQIAKASLLSHPVVKDFDVFGDFSSCLLAAGEAAMMNKFASFEFRVGNGA